MPRYFFHVHDDTAMEDRVGVVLPDAAEAARVAARMAEIVRALMPDKPFRIAVTDEQQRVVCEIDPDTGTGGTPGTTQR